MKNPQRLNAQALRVREQRDRLLRRARGAT
jgi:hypothetical protein